MEDRRCCPRCGTEISERPYLMARTASENVLSWRLIGWALVAVLVLLLVAR